MRIPRKGEARREVKIFMIPAEFRMDVPPWAAAAPMMPPTRAWDALTGNPMSVMTVFQRKALASAAITTASVTAFGSTMSFPIVLATAVVRNAPTMFMTAASVTALNGERTFVDTTVAIAFAESFQPLLMSKHTARMMMRIRISGMFQDYSLKDIRHILAPV